MWVREQTISIGFGPSQLTRGGDCLSLLFIYFYVLITKENLKIGK